jgi:N-acetylneuraminic acid mutarotase
MDAVALAMIESLPAAAPTVGWQTVGVIEARSGAANSTDGTNIYTSHGLRASGSAVSTFGNSTNAATGATAALPAASVARQGVAGAWCNGKHCAIGGLNGNANTVGTVEAYTPSGANGASGVWSTMAALPVTRSYGSAAVIGNFIYVAGGKSDSGDAAVQPLVRYDTVNNVWASLASMPAARTQGAMVAVGTKLYYLGGYDSSGTAQATVYVFDTTAGTWATGVAAPGVIVASAASVVGNVIYVHRWGSASVSSLYVFDVAGGAWTIASAAPPAHNTFPGQVTIGSSIYVVSGSGTANVDKLDLGAGTSYTTAVLDAKSLLNPLLAGVASILPVTPPTDTTGKAAYAQTVQTLKALAAL